MGLELDLVSGLGFRVWFRVCTFGFRVSGEGLGCAVSGFGLGIKVEGLGVRVYRGTSLTGKRTPLGPYRRPMPRVLGGPRRVGVFF